MEILKIKMQRRKRYFFNYVSKTLVNTPYYIVKLTQEEIYKLLDVLKETSNE